MFTRFIFNDKADAMLRRFYQTYDLTLDSADSVPPKTCNFVVKFIDKNFKKNLRDVAKETRIKIKRFRAEAKRNGLTLDEFFDILDEEEQRSAAEEAASAEQEEENPVDTEAETGESDGETTQETEEEGEKPSEAEDQEQTG